jgi:hypothetical protein
MTVEQLDTLEYWRPAEQMITRLRQKAWAFGVMVPLGGVLLALIALREKYAHPPYPYVINYVLVVGCVAIIYGLVMGGLYWLDATWSRTRRWAVEGNRLLTYERGNVSYIDLSKICSIQLGESKRDTAYKDVVLRDKDGLSFTLESVVDAEELCERLDIAVRQAQYYATHRFRVY